MENKHIVTMQNICKKAQKEYKYACNFIVKLRQVCNIVDCIESRLNKNLISLNSSVYECLEIAEELLCDLRKEAENTEELIWLEEVEVKINNIQ